jgi:outer membrane receptor for ferrienterochelin and colicins
MARAARSLIVIFTLLAAAPSGALAQQPLSDLSLEDLLRIDSGRVFGASLRTQPATEAPSSVSFVTAEDIERFGYRSLADILRGVRGFYVTDDRNFSFLGARGFGKPGDYNSRILLLVNGHRVNDNVFGQAEIGAEFGMDPATFERVEIIRGPGSSLYGDSAFFAVVNVITKSGKSLGPGALTMEGGSLGTGLVRGSGGHQFANGVDLSVAATYGGSRGMQRLYFPDFDTPETNGGVAEGLDGEQVRQSYMQLRTKRLTLTAAYGWRRRLIPTASFGTLFNEQFAREESTDRHSLLDLEYVRSVSGNGRLTARASYDRFTYDGTYPFAGMEEGDPTLIARNGAIGSRWTLGARLTHRLPSHHVLTSGTEIIGNIRQRQEFGYVNPDVSVLDLDRSSDQQAVYADDQWKPAGWLIVNGGARYDRYQHFDKVTPRAGFIVTPSPAQSFKYLYGRAFRAPNEWELNSFYFGNGVEQLGPETIGTHELVWEHYTNDWLRTSVSTYRYRAEGLITLVPDASTFLGTTYINEGRVVAKGLELEAQMRLIAGTQVFTSYALQSVRDIETDSTLVNSPRQMGKIRLSVPLSYRRSTVAAEVIGFSSRRTLRGNILPAAATADATVMVPLSASMMLTATARNLLDQQYSDPASDAHRQDTIPQNGRTFRVGLQLKLWK